jgi:hypothetical protein|tara:strand:- start:69 stop:473 length:405 start_codon:yes stop_codon:yes gene_type:complete
MWLKIIRDIKGVHPFEIESLVDEDLIREIKMSDLHKLDEDKYKNWDNRACCYFDVLYKTPINVEPKPLGGEVKPTTILDEQVIIDTGDIDKVLNLDDLHDRLNRQKGWKYTKDEQFAVPQVMVTNIGEARPPLK